MNAHGQLTSSGGRDYDLSQPFRRISVFDSILKRTRAECRRCRAQAAAYAEKLGVPIKDSYGLGKVQIEISKRRSKTNCSSRPLYSVSASQPFVSSQQRRLLDRPL